MNISTCEYSSGCESGWTMYLDQLSNSTDHYNPFVTKYEEKNGALFVNENIDQDQDQDEDHLSMVSDASSGPPHFHDDENNCGGVFSQYYGYHTPSFSEEKKKINNLQKSSKTKDTNIKAKKQQNLCLDDTASSPVFYFSQDNVPPSDFSQVFSGAHFEGESMTKKHLGFFKSSTKGNSGSWLGRKRQ